MSEWETMLADFMCVPKDENATWNGDNKNWAKSAALGGWDFSGGKVAAAGTTFWGCTTVDGEAASPGSDKAWAACYNADGPQKILQDDGSEKEVQIVEFNTVLAAVTHDLTTGPLPNGVWIGGEKHAINKKEIETGQNQEYSFTCVLCMRKGEKGFWIICTDSEATGKACILLSEFDKSAGCTAAMSKIVALEFAKWLKESGTDKNF